MPGPYTPPQPRRTQVVRPVRGAAWQRWRWWWLVPVLGLVPVMAAVLATQGAFTPPPVAIAPTQPVAAASQPQVTPTARLAAAPTSTANVTAASTAAAPTATTPTTSATPTTNSAPEAGTTTTASSAQPFVAYRVQAGDTVRFIAKTYGVSVASIAQASGLQNADRIRIGQVLTIPAQAGWLYRVQPGETLDQIAARTGVSSATIASASGQTIASVGPGTVLLIPDQSSEALAQSAK